jgi:hypothetical protein
MAVDIPQRAPKRSGIPQIGCCKRDKSALCPHKLHGGTEDQCDTISSFFVRRSVYLAFFGTLGCFGSQRVEQERLAKEEQERLAREEQERLAREEQERRAREEQERLAREEQERLAREEQERLVKEEQERLGREGNKASRTTRKSIPGIGERYKGRKRITQINFNVLAEEANSGQSSITTPQTERRTSQVEDIITTASASDPQVTSQRTEIHSKIKDRNDWIPAGSVWVDPSDTKELQRVALKYTRKMINMCDKNERLVKI